jgi:hypothetical protein
MQPSRRHGAACAEPNLASLPARWIMRANPSVLSATFLGLS